MELSTIYIFETKRKSDKVIKKMPKGDKYLTKKTKPTGILTD